MPDEAWEQFGFRLNRIITIAAKWLLIGTFFIGVGYAWRSIQVGENEMARQPQGVEYNQHGR